MDILKYLGKIFVEIGIAGSVISFILNMIKIKVDHDEKNKDKNKATDAANGDVAMYNRSDNHNALNHFTGMISIMTLVILILGIISLILYIIFA